jgi:membrane protein implicated in regulation of membrane protease activity
MHKLNKAVEVLFVLTLAALLVGGVLFVTGQAIALIFGQGSWLAFFNETIKPPMCIAASICAVAGFLLSYKRHDKQERTPQEAATR